MKVPLFYLWAMCCAAALMPGANAEQNSVSVLGNCRSMYFSPMTRTDSTLGQVTTYFTTYDGRRDVAPLGSSNVRFSGEVRTNSLDSRLYEADYMVHASA